jgi:hypothetical protein
MNAWLLEFKGLEDAKEVERLFKEITVEKSPDPEKDTNIQV